MSRPTVSIVVPSYNRGYILDRAIESVLAQTVADWELIVVDDGSQDNTKQVVEQFGDSRIHYLRHHPNQGVCAARNTGIEAAKGTYIAFLDSDDTWHPEKLEKQLQVFAKAPPTVGVVYTWLGFTDAEGTLKRVRNPRDRGNLRENLLFANLIGTPSTVMVKRDCLENGVRFDRKLRCGEDWDFYLQLAPFCEFEVVPEILVNYCDDNTSRSSQGEKATKNSQIVVEGHLIFREKHHQNIDWLDRKLGTLSPSEKSSHFFHLGQRLLCHGGILERKDAIDAGRSYLKLAIALDSSKLRFWLHYLAACLGQQTYRYWNEAEIEFRKTASQILSRLQKGYS
ncbi:glycosyltransferase family 2 protein [Baaleninema sp.]|uniref:glycosyltransferase family 2 protein n=1 Tax=Baaleninema sp. TaxID=3101197 RepID=UPI003D038E0A